MLANWAKFAGHSSAGPQKLNSVTRSAFWTKAFRRFLLQANGLNALNSLLCFVDYRFCFHCQPPLKKIETRGRELQEAVRFFRQDEVAFDSGLLFDTGA
jgi:hypothetical protein